jgi:UDP-glucose 4-epimerase
MNILITGGSGYIAGRLANHLNSSSIRFKVSLGSRKKTLNMPITGISNIEMDWNDNKNLSHICSDKDTIIHTAGMNADECNNNFIDAYSVNTINTAKLLKEAIRNGVQRFVYISTAHVYGPKLVGTINEKTSANSIATYAASHKAAEDIILNENLKGRIEGIVIRLSNSYGAPVSKDADCWHLLVNDLCYRGLTEKKLILKSSGEQSRDFIPLENVVRAIEHLICLPLHSIDNGIFNVGSGHSASLKEMTEKIANVFINHFNIDPEIQIKHHLNFEEPQGRELFEFDVSKLLSTGFVNKDISEREIINLIKFININFVLDK